MLALAPLAPVGPVAPLAPSIPEAPVAPSIPEAPVAPIPSTPGILVSSHNIVVSDGAVG